MAPTKQETLDTIDQLPDDTDMDEIVYRLYVLDKIRKGHEAVQQGNTINNIDLKQEVDLW